MARTEIFDTIPGRTLETGYDLEEGLFVEQPGVSYKGSGSIMVNAPADAGKQIICGDRVSLVTDKDYTVQKEITNEYMGYIIADPEGEPPVIEEDRKRRAGVGHMQPGNKYHLNLIDTNKACSPGKYIVNTATGFDVSDTKVNGVVLVAVESADANSGKFIDVFCKELDYVAPEVEEGG